MYMGWTFLLIYTVTLKWKKKSHLTLRAPVTILLTVPRSQVASSVYLIPDPPSYISSYDIQICDKSITGNGVRERRRVDDLGSPLTLYTVKNRINDQRCYIAIIYSQFECLILLQKTNFKAHSQKIFKIITCVCLIVVLFWFHLFIIIFFWFHLNNYFKLSKCACLGGGVFMEQKYRRKQPKTIF